jgi:hypothetical protein
MGSGDGEEEQKSVFVEYSDRRVLYYLARLFDSTGGTVRVIWFEGVVSE